MGILCYIILMNQIKKKIIALIAERDKRSVSEVTNDINAFVEDMFEDVNENGNFGNIVEWKYDFSCAFDIDLPDAEEFFCVGLWD